MPAAALAVVMALAVLVAPAARADGDPASDVLASQSVFLPADAGASPGEQRQLDAVVRDAAGRGFPIRVAVISSPADLGSVSALWHRPQPYAEFLGQELGLMFSGQVLVVMPNGFGLYHAGRHTATELAALARMRPASAHPAAVASDAVRRLAASAGHAVTQVPRAGPAAGTTQDAGPGAVSSAVLVAGALLVGLAWAASLRARPVRARQRLARGAAPPRG